MPSGITPPAATISRMELGRAEGVAICRAAEPESPCAHTLPSPMKVLAPTAR